MKIAEIGEVLKKPQGIVDPGHRRPLARRPQGHPGKSSASKVIASDFKELQAAYQKVDMARAEKHADGWISEAQKVIEPSRDEIVKSAAMYLGDAAR